MNKKTIYKTLIEQVEYEVDLPEELVKKLAYKRICTIKYNKIKFNATGFVIYKDIIIIIFPKSYKLEDDNRINIQEHIQVLFQTLLKYKNEANVDTWEMDLLGGARGEYQGSLFIAYRLIQDFVNNGLLIKEIKNKTLSFSGNIDWGTTIAKRQPLFSGNSVIYTEIISRKTTVDSQNQLIKLQKYCVYMSIEKFGWLFGFDKDNHILDVNDLNIDVSNAINFLTMELNSTYVEREVIVINLIRDFLVGVDQKQNEERIETLVTPYFQNVWELICSKNFNSQYSELKQIVPKLKWEIKSKAVTQSQRPDIIILKERVMYIYDAKYYNVDLNLPGWQDVVKQLFYAHTIFSNIKSPHFKIQDKNLEKKLKKIERVENIFLFPSGDKSPIKYIGKVNIENNDDFNDIKAYKVNTFYAMKCYIGKELFNYNYQIRN
ncbi:LlaJI family restriction endonuclease [Lederbergia graminis]|uniref:LlaJI family restriction endonuclease n=1 Tax=Lederbergia graminis TaxID=735518 RepID=A0ABW0LJL9_9BACI